MAVLVVAGMAFVMASCDMDTDPAPYLPTAYVTLYNASPDSPNLGIVVDGRQINSNPFEYADNTGYLRFYTGNRTIRFSPFGASNIVADTTLTLKDQYGYSLFVAGQYNHVEVVVLQDTADAPAAGKALIRIVNLSPDAAPVSLREKDASTGLTGNLSFKEASAFIEVDAKTQDFEIVSAGSEATLHLKDIRLTEGSFQTIVVRGYRTPPSGNSNFINADIVRN